MTFPHSVEADLDMVRSWMVAFVLGGWMREKVTKLSAALDSRAQEVSQLVSRLHREAVTCLTFLVRRCDREFVDLSRDPLWR